MDKPDTATCTWAEMGEYLHQRCVADPKCYRPRRMMADEPTAKPIEQPDDRMLRALNEQVASLRKTVGQLEIEIRALKVRTPQPAPARSSPAAKPAPVKPKTVLDGYER